MAGSILPCPAGQQVQPGGADQGNTGSPASEISLPYSAQRCEMGRKWDLNPEDLNSSLLFTSSVVGQAK